MRRTILTAVSVAGALCLFATPAAADGTLSWATVNSASGGDQDNSSVATSRDGYTAVVWEDDRDSANPGDNTHTEVYLRLYRDGATVFERKVSTGASGGSTTWSHVQPDVDVWPGGRTVVVWADDQDGNGYYQARVRTFDANGTLIDTATANADASGQQVNPEVAVDPDGGAFAVVFEDDQNNASPTVRLSGFSSIGSKRYERQVHDSGGTHRHADVAMGAAGNAIVVWDEDRDGNGYYNIGLASFTPGGGVKLAKRLANEATGGQQRNSTVAANFNGDFVVGWVTNHGGAEQVGVRSFTSDGSGPAEALLPGDDPQVGIDDQRYAVAYWIDGGDVYVQGLNPNGTPYGRQPRIRANTTVAGTQTHPAIAVDPYGRITMTYSDDNNGNGFEEVRIGTGLTNSTW